MPNCAVCGTPAPPPFRAPPPEGAPDLDGRPGEPTRSTLRRWLQRCRGCGACAPDVAALPATAAETVHSQAYQAEQSPFRRWALLAAGTDLEGEAWLQAAWAAEDAGEPSADLRRRAAAAWRELSAPDAVLRAADVLRRAGQFDEASERLNALTPGGDDPAAAMTAPIIALERRLIAAGDTGRHLLSSALRPPARTPHVAHGRAAAGGFWRRLLGTGQRPG